MHNREKWSLFDESTRVPLLISHPQSTSQGTHCSEPVEMLDVFPTIVDLLDLPHPEDSPVGICNVSVRGQEVSFCRELQGKSLASVVLGHSSKPSPSHQSIVKKTGARRAEKSLYGVAITQIWRCAPKDALMRITHDMSNIVVDKKERNRDFNSPWFDCNTQHTFRLSDDEMRSVMGYSFRSKQFRYTVWFPFDRINNHAILTATPLTEELYDHRGETLEDYTRLEYDNVARNPLFESTLLELRTMYITYLQENMIFKGQIVFDKNS